MYQITLYSNGESETLPRMSWEQVMTRMASTWFVGKLVESGVAHWEVRHVWPLCTYRKK